jgi:hypothetical protein
MVRMVLEVEVGPSAEVDEWRCLATPRGTIFLLESSESFKDEEENEKPTLAGRMNARRDGNRAVTVLDLCCRFEGLGK